MYLKIFPDEPDSPLWDPLRFVPNITVINLGTNDYSEGAPDISLVKRDFRAKFAAFLEELRGYYPDTVFILVAGPMISDEYPDGYQARSDIEAALRDLADARLLQGDDKVYLLTLTHQDGPWGEDWHPTAAAHRQAAEELVRFIEEKNLL